MSLIRPILGLASPAGPSARLSVLIFHRVLAEPDVLFPGELDAVRFDKMLSWLGSAFNVLPLDEAIEGARNDCLPARAAAITFDDGYADNHEVALPILMKHGVKATFFIATDFLDGGRMWNDTVIAAVRNCPKTTLALDVLGLGMWPVDTIQEKRQAIGALLQKLKYRPPENRQAMVDALASIAGAALPDNLMMTSDQVRELRSNGMVIGAHTCSHPILSAISPDKARHEIREGKRVLENLLGERIGLFAYPNGKPGKDFGAEHVEMARDAGFDAAVSTAWGALGGRADLHQIPRFTPWDQTELRFGFRMLRNLLSGQPMAAA
jgi:peptidoglycan/xylan/chitin deacetylase (PgdA/CDA1 family)